MKIGMRKDMVAEIFHGKNGLLIKEQKNLG